MRREAAVVALVGLAVVVVTVALTGTFGLVLLPVVFMELAEVLWGHEPGTGSSSSEDREAPDKTGRRRDSVEKGARMLSERDEIRLIEAARNGDEAAFTELIRRYQPHLRRLCRRLTWALDLETEELANEVWTKVWRFLPRLKDPYAFTGWLSRIATNSALDRKRYQARRPRPAEHELEERHHPLQEQEERWIDLYNWFADLDPEAAFVILLRERCDLSWSDVAATMSTNFPEGVWTERRCEGLYNRTLAGHGPKLSQNEEA